MEFVELDIAELIQTLDKLDPNAKPLWGTMSAQRMVEHLSDALKIASGKTVLKQEVPEEKTSKMLAFLNSEHKLPQNFEVSFAPKNAELRHEEIELAIDEFLLEWIDFEDHYAEHPERTEIHPNYGPLNYEQWCRLHAKHLTHHFEQFGLLNK